RDVELLVAAVRHPGLHVELVPQGFQRFGQFFPSRVAVDPVLFGVFREAAHECTPRFTTSTSSRTPAIASSGTGGTARRVLARPTSAASPATTTKPPPTSNAASHGASTRASASTRA